MYSTSLFERFFIIFCKIYKLSGPPSGSSVSGAVPCVGASLSRTILPSNFPIYSSPNSYLRRLYLSPMSDIGTGRRRESTTSDTVCSWESGQWGKG
jgi:hypothetical protein